MQIPTRATSPWTLWAAADIPGHQLNPVRDSVLGRLDDFVVGMLLAHWYARRAGAAPMASARRAALVVAGIAVATLGPLLWELAAVGILRAKWPVAFANNLFQLGAVAVMIALLAAPPRAGRSYPTLAIGLLGMMCYSLYVWHGVVMARVQPAPTLAGIAVYALALLTLSALSYRYIEFGRVRDWRQLLPSAR